MESTTDKSTSSNQNRINNYAGSVVDNKLRELHFSTATKVHFENFKHLLKKNGIEYTDFNDSRAQILTLSSGSTDKARIYFTGGRTWWGFSHTPIIKMDKATPNLPIYLICFADIINNKHYFLLDYNKIKKSNKKPAEGGRWIFNEHSDGLYNTYGIDFENDRRPIEERKIADEIKKLI